METLLPLSILLNSSPYTIDLISDDISSAMQITITQSNHFPTLQYQLSITYENFTTINPFFSSFPSISAIASFLHNLIKTNKFHLSQETKSLHLTITLPISDINDDISFTIPLKSSIIDKDAIIEELCARVSIQNSKIEALQCKIHQIESNSITFDQFQEIYRKIERVSSYQSSYNSIFVNPNNDAKFINRLKSILSNDILINTEDEREMIRQWIAPNKTIKMSLLYKASIDSDSAQAFHTKCDYHSKTLTLIKTDQGIRFGGYTEMTWNNDKDFKQDKAAFLFSLERQEKYPIKEEVDCGIYCRYDHGPTFGEGFDLCLSDNFFSGNGNYSNFPCSYGKGFVKGALTSHNFNFVICDVEVYQIEYDEF